jgi:hypothetical protein
MMASASVVGAFVIVLTAALGCLQVLSSTAEPPYTLPQPSISPDVATRMEDVVHNANKLLHRGMKGLCQAEMDFQEVGHRMQCVAKQLQAASALPPPLNNSSDDIVQQGTSGTSPVLGLVMPGLVNPEVYSSTESGASSVFEHDP